MPDLATILVLLGVAFAALVKGAIGIGFPLISTPLVATLVGVKSAVVIMAVPTLVSNVIVLAQIGVRAAQPRRFRLILVPLIAGTVLGGFLLAGLNAAVLSLALGATVLLYVAIRVFHPGLQIKPGQERAIGPVFGILSGLLGGTTNVFGPVLAMYLHALKLDARTFVGAVTLLFSVGNVTQVVTYAGLGLYDAGTLFQGALYCLPMAIGLILGLKAGRRLNQVVFDRLVLGVLTLSALNLIYRGVEALR